MKFSKSYFLAALAVIFLPASVVADKHDGRPLPILCPCWNLENGMHDAYWEIDQHVVSIGYNCIKQREEVSCAVAVHELDDMQYQSIIAETFWDETIGSYKCSVKIFDYPGTNLRWPLAIEGVSSVVELNSCFAGIKELRERAESFE